MERVLELLKQFLENKGILVVLVILLIVSIIMLLRKNKNVKNIEEQLSSLEVEYNTIKSMPLTFKLNKARSLAKVNELIQNDIEGYVESYEAIQKSIERMDDLFEKSSEAIEDDQLDTAETYVEDISNLVSITLKNVIKLNEKLDNVLEQELKLRSEVTVYKERFRVIKDTLNKRNGVLSFSEDVINTYVSDAENEFNAFDEWMYISEFDKADQALKRIDAILVSVEEVLQELPELLPVAKEIIPNKIANVSSLYSEVMDSNLYLEHLDVTQSLSVISESLSGDLASLRSGEISKVKESLELSNHDLDELSKKLEIELKANEDLVKLNKSVKESLNSIVTQIGEVNQSYADLSSRYNFTEFEASLAAIKEEDSQLISKHTDIVKSFKVKMPVSEKLEILRDFENDLNQLKLHIEKTKSEIGQILSEEKRANQQLLKLYLIINEITVKINDYQIPAISNDYRDDVVIAKQHITNIEALLNEESLNTTLLNSTLSESIDYIYKLYNNVNNIVGMALMVENAIVFANRYRANNPRIDSELSKGELYYRNGEYTQALTTVLAIIEEIHPNDYEKMIRENSTNVL